MYAVFKKLDQLKPFYDVVYKITMVFCKLLLVVDIIITSISVLGRYVPFIEDPSWSEEIVLTCMIYMTVISASMALRRNAHIRMVALDRYLPDKVVKTLDILADIAVMIFAILLIVKGFTYAVGIGSKGTYTSIPWLSKFWIYIPVPISGIFMLIFELETFYNHIKACFVKGDDI